MPYRAAFAAHTRKAPGFGPAHRDLEKTLLVCLKAIVRNQDWRTPRSRRNRCSVKKS